MMTLIMLIALTVVIPKTTATTMMTMTLLIMKPILLFAFRVLTPRSHQLMYGKPVELAAMTAGGDVSSEPAMRITGLTTTTVTAEDSSLIFVFMPMSSFTTLPETPYNVTDITSRSVQHALGWFYIRPHGPYVQVGSACVLLIIPSQTLRLGRYNNSMMRVTSSQT